MRKRRKNVQRGDIRGKAMKQLEG